MLINKSLPGRIVERWLVLLQNSETQTSDETQHCFIHELLSYSLIHQGHTNFFSKLDIIKLPYLSTNKSTKSPWVCIQSLLSQYSYKSLSFNPPGFPKCLSPTPMLCILPPPPSQRLHCFVIPFSFLIIILSHLTRSFQLIVKCVEYCSFKNEMKHSFQLHLTSELLSLVVQFFLKTLHTCNTR